MFTNYDYETGKTTLTTAAKSGIIAGVAVLSLGLFRVTAVTRIPANTVGVKVSAIGGVQDKTMQTGYHLLVPFVDKVYKLPTSVQTKTMEKITTQTKDGQWLNTNIDVKYKVNKQEAMTVFENYQDAGDEIEKAIKDESVKQKQVDSAKQDQEKVKIEAETKKIQAQADADAEVIKAQGQADANAKLSGSITEPLIRMKEAEARLEHGWVEVITNGDVITDKEK